MARKYPDTYTSLHDSFLHLFLAVHSTFITHTFSLHRNLTFTGYFNDPLNTPVLTFTGYLNDPLNTPVLTFTGYLNDPLNTPVLTFTGYLNDPLNTPH